MGITMIPGRKGQVAIWIIIALIMVITVAIFFVFQKELSLEKEDEFSPQSYMQECIRASLDDSLEIMLPQGGFVDPRNYKLHNDTKVEYLCMNAGYFAPCRMQHPALFNEMEMELNNFSYPRISSCYDSLKFEMEQRGATVTYGDLRVNATIAPGKILMTVNKSFLVQQPESSNTFDSFEVEVRSNAYELARLAIEIANQEARNCYFEYVGHMLLYPDIDIRKDVLSDDTKIYTLTYKRTGEQMRTAIKGCTIPAGI